MDIKSIGVNAVVSAVVASLVCFVGLRLVSDQSDQFAAATGANRYGHSTFSTRGLRISTSTTPSNPADGALEVTGASSFLQGATFSYFVQADSLRYGAAPASITASTTMVATAANVCDPSILLAGTQAVTSTLILPSSTAWIGDCLSLSGGVKILRIDNTSTTASNLVITAGDASTTIRYPVVAGVATTTLPFVAINEVVRMTVYNVSSSRGTIDIEFEKFVQ